MSEFDELKRLASVATPGKWEYSRTSSGFRKIKASDKLICGVSSFGCQDAKFIAAANPATILALIARVEAAEAGLAQEKRRMDFVINSRRVFHGLDETTNNDGIRSTIDELMGE